VVIMETKTLIQSGLENQKNSLVRILDSLTAAELKWQPKPDSNSIGLILFHMARAEDFFVTFVIQGKPEIWETEKWYLKLKKEANDSGGRYTQEQCHNFVVPDLKDLLAYFDAVRKQTLEYIKNLTPDQFDRSVSVPPMGPPPQKTPDGKAAPPRKPPFEPIVGSLLFFNLVHLVQHLGELSYIRGLIRGMDK
jgi:hypothetical protein